MFDAPVREALEPSRNPLRRPPGNLIAKRLALA
jgi:hypothetical protein